MLNQRIVFSRDSLRTFEKMKVYKLIIFLGICPTFSAGSKLPGPTKICNHRCQKVIGCYYQNLENEAVEESPNAPLTIEDIDVSLCTHLLYSSVRLGNNGYVQILEPYIELGEEINGFKRLNELRKKNGHLKTLVSMGAWNERTDNYTNSLADPILREKLANNVVEFVTKYEFNGINLYWEYLIQRGDAAADKENFVLYLKALREKFDKEGFTLSLTVGASEESAQLYDIKGISRYANFINLRTFDFHSTSDSIMKVGHNAPIFPSSKENADERKLNLNYAVKYWISLGAPPRKLILGTAFHGISYTLSNPQIIGRGAPFSDQGNLSSSPEYNDICPLLKDPEWKHLHDREQQVPYIYKGNQIIAYDDVESIRKKAEYVQKMNLGGAVVDSINQDDFSGTCGRVKFPLLKTLNRALRYKC